MGVEKEELLLYKTFDTSFMSLQFCSLSSGAQCTCRPRWIMLVDSVHRHCFPHWCVTDIVCKYLSVTGHCLFEYLVSQSGKPQWDHCLSTYNVRTCC